MKQLTKNVMAMLAPVFVVFAAGSVRAVDHNNIDANRPLSFDDAEAIGWGEQSLEVGAAFVKPSGKTAGGEFEVEYLYGFAPNTHLNVGIDPSVGIRASETGRKRTIATLTPVMYR